MVDEMSTAEILEKTDAVRRSLQLAEAHATAMRVEAMYPNKVLYMDDTEDEFNKLDAALAAPRICVAFGTRPEYIKLQPVVEALQDEGCDVVAWYSQQQSDLLLGKNAPTPWLEGLTPGIAAAIGAFKTHLDSRGRPYDCVIVQGDTATAFMAATTAFLAGVPVAHVEAGMRTYADEPHPEEAFRKAITAFSRWHFAPSRHEELQLFDEGVEPSKIWVVGNTVIDTLPKAPLKVLVTLHRRENWNERIFYAMNVLNTFAALPGVEITVIRHPNWNAQSLLCNTVWPNLNIVAPQPREALLEALRASNIVVTDSGGLQEEAAHFGIPVLVLRTSTERASLLENGAVTLVHPDRPEELRGALSALLNRRSCYGDGTAAQQIARVLTAALTRVE